MNNKQFAEIWEKEGKSGSYPEDGKYSHEAMNKDTRDRPYFKEAVKVAEKHTVKFLKEKLKDKINDETKD